MEGRGVTNYDVSKPNFNITTSTTEFDDELMRRNIVSFEQCMIGKGATPNEASRLANLHRLEQEEKQVKYQRDQSIVAEEGNEDNQNSDDARNCSSSDESDEDDEFMMEYRKKRIQELKDQQQKFQFEQFQMKSKQNGLVRNIRRSEWTEQVNEVSKQTISFHVDNCSNGDDDDYSPKNNTTTTATTATTTKTVIVFLSSNPDPDPYPEYRIEQSIETLATRHPYIHFVKINYKDAIPNWPITNLPTLFVYQRGEATHKLVGLKQFTSLQSASTDSQEENENDEIVVRVLEKKLSTWGVIWKK